MPAPSYGPCHTISTVFVKLFHVTIGCYGAAGGGGKATKILTALENGLYPY
jgi:hypothetical protein